MPSQCRDERIRRRALASLSPAMLWRPPRRWKRSSRDDCDAMYMPWLPQRSKPHDRSVYMHTGIRERFWSRTPPHTHTHTLRHPFTPRMCALTTSDSAANAVPCPSVAVSPIQFHLSAGVVGIASDDVDPCKETRLRLISRLPRSIPPPPSCCDTASQGLSRDTPKRRRRTFDRASASRSNDSARIRISWCVQGCAHKGACTAACVR